MFKIIFRNKLSYFFLISFFLLFIWWIKIYLSGVKDSDENYWFGLAYAIIPLVGGVNGLLVSKKWGAHKSLMGRSIIYLSAGLLCYSFGQVIWSYYNLVLRVEVPYPSIADFGYFSAIIFYAAGMYSFAKISGAKVTFSKLKGKIVSFVIPGIMLAVSYYLFLRHIVPDFSHPVKTFLDFGTPVGYAVVISLALVAYFLTKGVLGGLMKNRVLFIIFALIFENITDNTFLYQAAAGTYYNAGINDLMFVASFTIMSIGLLALSGYEQDVSE